MASPYLINKYYASFRGLDVRSNDLTRGTQNASEMLNAAYTKTGAIVKRGGSHVKTPSTGGGGLTTWQDINLTSGATSNKLVAIDDNLSVLRTGSINVTYSGLDLAYAIIYLDKTDGIFYLDVFEDSDLVLHFNMGMGIEESTPVTISDASAAINALTNFSTTLTGDGTVPAAFLDIEEGLELSTATALNFNYWEQANSPATNPLSAFWAKRNQLDFELASTTILNNVLYVSTYWNELHKYDGQTFYRAGMPAAPTPSAADAGAGNITNTATRYIMTYIQKDNKNNIVEGIESAPSGALNLTNRQTDVTVTNILASTGFNTGCAIVDGAQVTTNTITVDDGSGGPHTLKVGDTAYFYDSVSSAYTERLVTAITGTSITVAGAAVTIADNNVISNNLRIALYRNQAAGTTYSLVAEIPNNSFTATQVYDDNLADSSLGAEYIPPIKPHGLPPRAKYSTSFRSQLILTGKVDSPNEVFYSDIDSPEFYPSGDNAFIVDTEFGDIVTGISGNNQSLFVFKQRSIHQVSGDLAQDVFRVDRVNAGEIGCVAHHTIKEVEGVLFFLSDDGVYAIASNEIAPKEISVNIEPKFQSTTTNFNSKQAVAINWLEKDKYILFMPEVEVEDGSTVANTGSRTFVFDYFHGAWLEWDSLNMLGGVAVLEGVLWFTERREATEPNDAVFHSRILKQTGNPQDFADHTETINFVYKTHWEALNEPSIFKKFLRLKVFSLDPLPDNFSAAGFHLTVEGENSYIPNPVFTVEQDFTSGLDTIGWGIGEWGTEPWGSSRVQELVSKLGNTKSRSLRLNFKNEELLESVYISGWELEVATPYKVKIKE